jgi:hypothetical protein
MKRKEKKRKEKKRKEKKRKEKKRKEKKRKETLIQLREESDHDLMQFDSSDRLIQMYGDSPYMSIDKLDSGSRDELDSFTSKIG